jgi:hypothetical protein
LRETRTKVPPRLSEKNETARGKPSIVRKKASATKPSPVSAEMAATIRGDEHDMDFDDATMVATDLSAFQIPRPGDAQPPVATPATATPIPSGDYDPKNLSTANAAGKGASAAPGSSKATRETPIVVAPAKPARTSPAIVRRNPAAAAPGATVETPKVVREELSAKLVAPTPAPPPEPTPAPPPEMSPAAAAPKEKAGGFKMGHLMLVAVVMGAVAGGAFMLLGGNDSSEETASAPPAQVEPEKADDSVGNLIKKADEKFVAGELIGDGGALSLLVAARVASPEDDRVALRLGPLADKFQELGQSAYTAGDLVEAAEHFKNSIEADPERYAVAKQLAAIEAEIKAAEEKKK